MMNQYATGSLVRLTGTFKNTAGTVTDPTAINLKWRNPVTAAVTTLTFAGGDITKDSTGIYHYDLTVSDPGDYRYRWEGTGAVVAAIEGVFQVKTSRVS